MLIYASVSAKSLHNTANDMAIVVYISNYAMKDILLITRLCSD